MTSVIKYYEGIDSVAVIGNYLPRQCGIATFTTDWEFMQVGNCGSPLETDDGWIVITHGVETMRQYCIGAMLLDLENPTKIIARLDEPLLAPHDKEREGYGGGRGGRGRGR